MGELYAYGILTEYALDHVDECCFIFDRKISASDTYSDTFYRRCFLCRDVSSETFIEANYNPNHKDNQGKLTRKEELSKVVESSEKIAAIMDELPGGFGKTLKYHMERLDINEEELSYRSHISTQTMSAMNSIWIRLRMASVHRRRFQCQVV